jgi:16S rRNA (cytosine1402-N4)-methyltransferase
VDADGDSVRLTVAPDKNGDGHADRGGQPYAVGEYGTLFIKPDGSYADGTLGGGGHAERICSALSPEGLFVGIDRDVDAILAAEKRLSPFPCQKCFVHDNHSHIKAILANEGIAGLDGAILDLGVSSWQLDNPERGFSYMQDAPLDMRMDGSEGLHETDALTAYKVVNGYDERRLARILRGYGEERWASRIAQFIVKERQRAPIVSTSALTEIIKAAIPASARREGPHPAKRSFQAIRIEVNAELAGLGQAVLDFLDVMHRGGRLAVITFHSLEDRIVKEAMRGREQPCTCPPGIPTCVCGKVGDVRRITRKPIVPSGEETDGNPRARSAKLRVAEKL